jgi:hypothetical protein
VSRASGRRGLLLSALLLMAILTVLDLARSGSLIRSAWSRAVPPSQTPIERGLDEFRRTRGEAIRR